MDKREFRESMALLFTTFRQSIDPQVSDAYYVFLKDYTLDEIRRAVVDIVKSQTFFPSVAQIVDAINGEECTELEMKQDIIKAIGDCGTYKSPEFQYQISHAISKSIGWFAMCNMSEEELGKLLHFRFKDTLSEWKRCKRDGIEFLPPSTSGKRELRGRGSASKLDFKQAVEKLKE